MSSTTTLLRRLLIIALTLVLVPFAMMVIITPLVGMWGGNHMWTGSMAFGTGLGWLWPLLWLLVSVGVGSVLYLLVADSDEQEPDTALDELRAAYARGDLSEEEFERRRKQLRRDD